MSAGSRLLVIKTSSLGDVVHALPAISDIAASGQQWEIDWVCEEAFADIPSLHRAVARVIPCAVRRWRTAWATARVRSEIAAFKAELMKTRYDVVLDLQGLLKSAAIARLARGERHGYAWSSARERLASLAYRHKHHVAWGQHAIDRNRQLAAAALTMGAEGGPRYGLAIEPLRERDEPYVVALHATSRDDKLWPEQHWRQFLGRVAGQGFRSVLPWGNDAERARSLRLALDIPGTTVPERMAPGELARVFAGATAVVGVDTGLVHLAAAVGVPVSCIFVATNPALTGVLGERAPAINLGGNGVTPGVETVSDTMSSWLANPFADRATR